MNGEQILHEPLNFDVLPEEPIYVRDLLQNLHFLILNLVREDPSRCVYWLGQLFLTPTGNRMGEFERCGIMRARMNIDHPDHEVLKKVISTGCGLDGAEVARCEPDD